MCNKYCKVDEDVTPQFTSPPILPEPLLTTKVSETRPSSLTKWRWDPSSANSTGKDKDGGESATKKSKGVVNPFPDPLPRDQPTEYLCGWYLCG